MIMLVGKTCQYQPQQAAVETVNEERVIEETAVPDLSAYPWAFLRDGRPLAADEDPAEVIVVGDLLLGRGVADEADPFRGSAAFLSQADWALANLEGVLVGGGEPRQAEQGGSQPIILQADPESARLLAAAGLDMVGLANNHSLDFGEAGLQETIGHVQVAGLKVIGIEGDPQTAQPFIQTVNGLRVAFLAFNAVPDPDPDLACPNEGLCAPRPALWDPQASLDAIWEAKSEADFVIVSIHWGYEYQPVPESWQESTAHTMLEAGAGLVVGHHAHVPQIMHAYNNKFVAFSLGNFLFDQGQDETGHGLAIRAFFDAQGLRAVQALPLQAGKQPRLLSMAEAESWLPALLPAAAHLGFRCSAADCVPVEAPPSVENSHFFAGQIDLTGDGQLETVRRAGQQITVYEGEDAVWSSPEAWRVVDVALGDPNDDGRYEIMLAILQDDAEGFERSQPYIVGYRGGRYDLLWGGRPVADPILELDVGDVDGDGTDELVVIEALAGGSETAVSVWRWAGWTFSKVWRSELGHYSDLILVKDGGTVITVDPGQGAR